MTVELGYEPGCEDTTKSARPMIRLAGLGAAVMAVSQVLWIAFVMVGLATTGRAHFYGGDAWTATRCVAGLVFGACAVGSLWPKRGASTSSGKLLAFGFLVAAVLLFAIDLLVAVKALQWTNTNNAFECGIWLVDSMSTTAAVCCFLMPLMFWRGPRELVLLRRAVWLAASALLWTAIDPLSWLCHEALDLRQSTGVTPDWLNLASKVGRAKPTEMALCIFLGMLAAAMLLTHRFVRRRVLVLLFAVVSIALLLYAAWGTFHSWNPKSAATPVRNLSTWLWRAMQFEQNFTVIERALCVWIACVPAFWLRLRRTHAD